MGFLIFLWNMFARAVALFGFILMEIIVFAFFCTVFPPFAILTPVFIIWIVIDIILRIFVGGSSNIISYIFSKR